MPKTIYYDDLCNDDFARTNIKTERVGSDYTFIQRSPLRRALEFAVYYLIAFPLVFLFDWIYMGLKFENIRALWKLKGGFFLYGNHTHYNDAFLGPLAAWPRRAYVVSSPDAVSIKGLRSLVAMLGALPIPEGLSGMSSFMSAVEERCRSGACVVIYPEAHIWPYYTGIRPFGADSFHYPAKLNAPVVAMTSTYSRRRFLFIPLRRPRLTVTFSEPFYPDMSLPVPKRRQALRDSVYEFMCSVSESKEQYEYIKYVKNKS